MTSLIYTTNQTVSAYINLSTWVNAIIRPYVTLMSTADHLFRGADANAVDNWGEIVGNIWLGSTSSSWSNSVFNRTGATINCYLNLK